MTYQTWAWFETFKGNVNRTNTVNFGAYWTSEARKGGFEISLAAVVSPPLRGEQAGFRKGRNTTEQIFVLRNIIEQVAEWNTSLYLCFVDYEKAFNSVHRDTLWRIMRCYGIPTKIVRMVQVMYTNCGCAVVDGDGRTDWFEVKSGVKQGCNT